MKKRFIIIGLLLLSILFVQSTSAQVAEIKAETYQAEFEKRKSIDDVSDYWGPMIPIALINISASADVTEVPSPADNIRLSLPA